MKSILLIVASSLLLAEGKIANCINALKAGIRL